MQTFFVNTTSRKQVFHPELLDIPMETRRLIALAPTPLKSWASVDQGYQSCEQEMGRLIDTYSELTNEFKLLVYVDLLEFPEYRTISDRLAVSTPRRFPCALALRKLISCYICETLCTALYDHGRSPVDIAIVFEQDTPNIPYVEAVHGATCAQFMWDFLGLPSYEEFCKQYEATMCELLANCNPEEDELTRAQNIRPHLYEMLLRLATKPLLPRVDGSTHYLFERLATKITSTICLCTAVVPTQDQLLEWLLDLVPDVGQPLVGLSDLPDEAPICVPTYASLITDTAAERSTLHHRTQRTVNLSVLLLQSIKGDRLGIPMDPHRNILPIDEELLLKLLRDKSLQYRSEYNAIRKSRDYARLGITPPLYSLECSKLGLNKYGEPEVEYSVQKVDMDADTAELKELAADRRETVESRTRVYPLLNEHEFGYTPFVSKYRKEKSISAEVPPCKISEKTTPKQDGAQTAIYQKAHRDFFTALENHLRRTLPRYAIHSTSILPRRSQEVPWSENERQVPNFALHQHFGGSQAEEPGHAGVTHDAPNAMYVEEAQTLADHAYTNVQRDFFSAGAAMIVAKTDIKAHCDKLINTVDQIRKSLTKIMIAFIILLGTVLGLYIPYVVIQHQEILDDKLFPLSVVIALLSIALPLVILCVCFVYLREKQRKKFAVAWAEFVNNANAAMAKNEQAVRLYEQYLTFYIPALRWTHEYCEHVKYFADHTRIARGKMEHHEEKLRVYIESIGNILEDLEGDYDNPFTDYEDERREERVVSSGRRPDHKHAFCSSRANVAYYSIIEQDQLARLYRDVPADDSARYYQ